MDPNTNAEQIMTDILGHLNNSNWTVTELITHMLNHSDPNVIAIHLDTVTIVDALYSHRSGKKPIGKWLCSKAEDLYQGEVRKISRHSFGLHIGASRVKTAQLEEFSVNEMSRRFQEEIPYLWRLLLCLLASDSSVGAGAKVKEAGGFAIFEGAAETEALEAAAESVQERDEADIEGPEEDPAYNLTGISDPVLKPLKMMRLVSGPSFTICTASKAQ